MTTIDQELSQLRAGKARLTNEHDQIADTLAKIAKQNPRGVSDPAALAQVGDLRTRKQNLAVELDQIDARIAEWTQAGAEDAEVVRRQSEVHPTGVSLSGSERSHSVARVGSGPHTYERHDPRTSFLRDLFAAQLRNDPDASERLRQHGREMVVDGRVSERALTTGGVAAFVPPAYLQDEFAELVRAGRPTANLCRAVPLPATGMTVNVPKLSTGTTTAVQGTQNTAVSETDADDTAISASVVTIAGQQTISRQLLERSEPGMDEVILGDLAGAYAVSVDDQVVTAILAQSGINAVTYTDSSPTVAELYPKLADAVQRVTGNRYAAPTAWVLHPRRWGWMLSALDSTGRPLVVPAGHGPMNASGVGTGQMGGYADGSVGTLLGIPVYLDANVPTNLGSGENEDRIILARFEDSLIMEDPAGAPHLLQFEANADAAKLSVLLVAYGYMAFTAARQPKGIAVIGGTGCVGPSF